MMGILVKVAIIKNAMAALVATVIVLAGIQVQELIDYQSAQLMPVIKGTFQPSATNREFFDFKKEPDGTSFNVRYYKAANCTILGFNWYVGETMHLPIPSQPPIPTLSHKQAGQIDHGRWYLAIDELAGTEAVMFSLCNDGELVISPFYPSDISS